MRLLAVDLIAPIPAGADCLVLTLEKSDGGFLEISKVNVVIDRTNRVVYGDMALAHKLSEGDSSILPADDIAGALGPTWRIIASAGGKIASAVVAVGTDRQKTWLYFAEDSATTYRG
ncbi:hypothetical protein BH09MYX1_BH09MYX1_57540 [soil metagenome]